MLPQYKRCIAISIAALLALALILGIPAFCPGFPVPVVSQVQVTSASQNSGEAGEFSIMAHITNKGTAGNVVIRTRLLNASRESVEAETKMVIYMRANEERTFTTRVHTPAGDWEPYQAAIVVERRTPFSGS